MHKEVTVLMLTCEHQRHFSPSTSRRICSSFFCFCGCCNSASARRVRIFCIRWSRSALICAHSLSSCARRSVSSAGTFFLYRTLCSRLAQKSMAMVRSCTSTFISRFSFCKKIGTATIRCRLRYPFSFGCLM